MLMTYTRANVVFGRAVTAQRPLSRCVSATFSALGVARMARRPPQAAGRRSRGTRATALAVACRTLGARSMPVRRLHRRASKTAAPLVRPAPVFFELSVVRRTKGVVRPRSGRTRAQSSPRRRKAPPAPRLLRVECSRRNKGRRRLPSFGGHLVVPLVASRSTRDGMDTEPH